MTIKVPNVFVAGAIAKAEEVNENFNTLLDAINSQEETLDQKLNTSLEEMNTLKTEILEEIEVTGVENKANKNLDNVDWNNLSAETQKHFRAGAGLPPSICRNMTIKEDGTAVKLSWQDPEDTILERQVLCTWGGTKIVKKLNSYPEDEDDGTLVVDSKVRNQYLDGEYSDTITEGEDWKYRAFPYSVNDVVCYDDKNKFTKAIVYEYYVNPNEKNPNLKITRVPGSVNENFINMGLGADNVFSMGDWGNSWVMQNMKPCMLKYNGEVAYYLNKQDYTYKADGTASDVSNTAFGGNCMIEHGQYWVKLSATDTGLIHVRIANIKVDDSYKCFTHINNLGELVEAIYLMAYQPGLVDGKYRSLKGLSIHTNVAMATQRTYAQANGVGHDLMTIGQIFTLQLLTMLMTGTTDSQSALGKGRDSNNANATTGEMIGKGMFAGTKATGGMIAFGTENLFANYWKRVLGLMVKDGVFVLKLSYDTSDGSTVVGYNLDGTGFFNTGISSVGANNSYISKMQIVGGACLVPTTIGGSATTDYCDSLWQAEGGSALVGGAYDVGASCGLFCLDVYNAPSYADGFIGGSLSYIPQ